jgi:hypothetical protein
MPSPTLAIFQSAAKKLGFAFSPILTYACAEVNMDTTLEAKQRNRRRSQRRKPRTSVKVQCRKGAHGLGADLAFTILDISDSGLRLIAKQETDQNAEVEIIISGYGMKEPIKRIGVVRWQLKLENGHFCTGVEFQKRIDYRDWQNLASPS